MQNSNMLMYTTEDYLKMTRWDNLTTKGQITHRQAIEKAHAEYEKYKAKQEDTLSLVEQHLIKSIRKLEKL